MSTRSVIARKNSDGSYESIYCHSDGYPEHHAPILLEHYATAAKVQALLELGDLSQLAEEIGDKHPFDDPPGRVCFAYGRDRGDEGAESLRCGDAVELMADVDGCCADWIYLFENGSWSFGQHIEEMEPLASLGGRQ